MTKKTAVAVVWLAAVALLTTALPDRASAGVIASWTPPYPGQGSWYVDPKGVANGACYAPSYDSNGMIEARAISYDGTCVAQALQGGVNFLAPVSTSYTITAEIKYAGRAETVGLLGSSALYAAIMINGQVSQHYLNESLSVPIPNEWLEGARTLFEIAHYLDGYLQAHEAKTCTMEITVWLNKGQWANIYAGVKGDVWSALTYARAYAGAEVKRITISTPDATGGGGFKGRPAMQ